MQEAGFGAALKNLIHWVRAVFSVYAVSGPLRKRRSI